jgi:hypothetical protein
MTADSIYTYRNDTCGATPTTVFPNNMVGHGRINLVAAIQRVRPDLDIAVRELPPVAQLRVYPNPFSSTIHLETTQALGEVQLEWRNVLGQQMQQAQVVLDAQTTVQVPNWPSGVYWLTVKQAGTSWSYKVIRQ